MAIKGNNKHSQLIKSLKQALENKSILTYYAEIVAEVHSLVVYGLYKKTIPVGLMAILGDYYAVCSCFVTLCK